MTLQVESFTLPSVMTMLDFTPASFAETGEVEAIKAVVSTQGTEKLGKAERYLHELAKVSTPKHPDGRIATLYLLVIFFPDTASGELLAGACTSSVD